ncbi:MAG: VOC family protein [Planctomycetota bacterium]
MKKPFFCGAGGIVSADIAVPEHEREVNFYSTVLGTGEAPLWREDLMNNLGTPIIGLGARTPEYEDLPLQWMPHIQVADVAASAALAVQLGGKDLMHGKSEDGTSQWALLSDPAEVAFGVIPAVVNAPTYDAPENERFGCISGLSLRVFDANQIADFYRQVIGWGAKSAASSSNKPTNDFEMHIEDETASIEIREMASKEDGIPQAWLIHLPVADFAESIRRVSAGGGEVIEQCGDESYAIVRDPVGVCFVVAAESSL